MTMKMTMIRRIAAMAALASAAAACTGTFLRDEEGGKMTLRDYCKETECEHEREECLEAASDRCSNCYDTCLDIAMMDGDASCLDTCDRACNADSCGAGSCEGSACAKRGFEFEPSETRNEALYEACRLLAAWYASCGEPLDLDCDRVARVYRPESAAAVECEANLACGVDFDSCWPDPPAAGTLGDEGCSRIDLLCAPAGCNTAWREDMNQLHAFLRADVLDALRLCFGESTCDDLVGCVDAWVEAVFGPM